MEPRITFHFLFFALFSAVLASCDQLPKDPGQSFEQARDLALRVGVINAPRWAITDSGALTGEEVEIIKGFAKKFNMQIEWIVGSEHTLMPRLEENDIHLVIGGITKDTAWKKRVALTNPHSKEEIVLCGVDDSNIKGVHVGVRKSSATGAYVRKKGGIPVYLDSLATFEGPVALAKSELTNTNLTNCSKPIKTEHHVIAVAKGENRLLLELETYINESGYR